MRPSSGARMAWLLVATLILLLVPSAKHIAGAVMANIAQADLTRSAVSDVRDAPTAATHFEMVLRVWPGYAPAWRGLWRSLAVAGEYREAEVAIERLLSAGQQDDIAAMTLGLVRWGRGDREGAFQAWQTMGKQIGGLALYFDSARKERGGKVEPLLFAGQSVAVDGRLVRDLAEAGIQAGYSDVWLYLIIGDYYTNPPADWESALRWYLAGRQAFPGSFIPPAYAAFPLTQLGRYEEARQMLREAYTKSLAPRDDYLVWIGQTYLAEKRPDLAVPEFEHAVAIAPDNPERRIILGDTYLALGRTEQARVQFEAAERLKRGLEPLQK